jgi:hypothetical protein
VEEMRQALLAVGMPAKKWKPAEVMKEATRLGLDKFVPKEQLPPDEPRQPPPPEGPPPPPEPPPPDQGPPPAPPPAPVPEAAPEPVQAQTGTAVAEHPVHEAMLKAFPDARMTPRGEVEAESGGRKVYVGFDPERNTARIDFEDLNKPGVPVQLQRGSIGLMKGIRELIGHLAEQGVGVEYRAVDSNRTERKGTLNREARSRADFYAKILHKVGYEQVSDEGGVYRWKPAEKAAEAPAYSRESVAEKTPLQALGERFDKGEKLNLPEVFEAAGLTDREKHVLEQRLQGRSHDEIAGDPEMKPKKGLKPLSRQRVEQIEQEARAKLGLEESIAKEVHAQDKAEGMASRIEAGKTVTAAELHAEPEAAKKVRQKRTRREKELEDAADAFLAAAEEAKKQGYAPDVIKRVAREHADAALKEPEGERQERTAAGPEETRPGGPEARGVAPEGAAPEEGGGGPGGVQAAAPGEPTTAAEIRTADYTLARLSDLHEDFKNPNRSRADVENAVASATKDLDVKALRQTAKDFGITATAGKSAKGLRKQIVDRIYDRQDRYRRSEEFSKGPAAPEQPPAAKSKPQDREEYLRDVIAVMRGKQSPNFSPDQEAVKRDAAARTAGKGGKELRKAIDAAEEEWRQAKADAEADYQRWQQEQTAKAPTDSRESPGLTAEQKAVQKRFQIMPEPRTPCTDSPTRSTWTPWRSCRSPTRSAPPRRRWSRDTTRC